MPRYCSEEVLVVKLATGTQTVIQWLSVMLLKISIEIFHAHRNVSSTTNMVVAKQTESVFIVSIGVVKN